MIALDLLARFPELKDLLSAPITTGMGDYPAKIATVNGRDVQNFIWGDIAEQLGKAEAFRDHWVSGPKAMSEGNWMRLIYPRPECAQRQSEIPFTHGQLFLSKVEYQADCMPPFSGSVLCKPSQVLEIISRHGSR